MWSEWRQKRRAEVRARVTDFLRAKPGATGYQLMRGAHLSGPRLYVALGEMESAGEVTSCWQDGPYPRRRLYRLAEEA